MYNQVYKRFRRFGHNLTVFKKFTYINKKESRIYINLTLKFNGHKYNYPLV